MKKIELEIVALSHSITQSHSYAVVLGEAGMTTAMHEIGYVMTDVNPDYVVLGETRNFNFDII